jgi:hypothetical protein
MRDESTVEVLHYKPFVQQDLLQALLGESVYVVHLNSIDVFDIKDVREGENDGTVNGCLLAFKEFIQTNLKDYVSPEELDFSLSVSDNGQVSTSSSLVTAMQDAAVLPTHLMSIMNFLTYRVPVYQAYEKASEGFTKFIEPNTYRYFLDTAVGAFECNHLFGSYAIKSEALQGFVIGYLNENGCALVEDVTILSPE